MLLTQKDVAEKLNVSRKTVRDATEAGLIKAIQLPGHTKPRYVQQHIDEFLASGKILKKIVIKDR